MNFKTLIPIIASVITIASVSGIFIILDQPDIQADSFERFSQPIVYVTQNQSKFFQGTQEIKKISSESELRQILLASSMQSSVSTRVITDSLVLEQRRIEASSAIAVPESEPRPEPEPEQPQAEPGAPSHGGLQSFDESSYKANPDYSTTNIQVKGVDEPDFIKNDNKYVYIVSNNMLTIIDAYPPDTANVLLKVALDVDSQNLQDMFLNDDRLLIFYQDRDTREVIPQFEFEPHRQSYRMTHALVIDVSDRTDPDVIHNYSVDGRLQDSRMIGDHVYFVTSNGIDYHYPTIPRVMESSRIVAEPDLFYFDNFEEFSNIVTMTSINLFDDKLHSESFLMGHTGTIYASENAFYLTYQQNPPAGYYETLQKNRFFDVVVPLLPENIRDQISVIQNDQSLGMYEKWRQISDMMQDEFNRMDGDQRDQLFQKIKDNIREYDLKIQQELRQTVIHKISVNEGDMEYHSKGSVPGWLLNQFSMDEHNGNFRIATTNEFHDRNEGRIQYNSVYVLNEDMETVGELEEIALDERIYSARFMGDRLYLVTFKQIDPFFVIDLSTDTPKVLGELKIPGFSNYLHPYSDDYIIGMGRDTKETSSGRVQQLGIKIALFDVRDVNNPTVLDDVIIGDHRTHSYALDDHKAFMFDRQKQILSIPIQSPLSSLGIDDFDRRDQWYGYHVFDVSESGFEEKGQVMHSVKNHAFSNIEPRSFYIGNVLYTTSDFALKMNDIDDISDEINSVKLEGTGLLVELLE